MAAPCADGLFSVPVGTELRYALEVGEDSDSQSAAYVLRLQSTRVEASERVDSWQFELRVPDAERALGTAWVAEGVGLVRLRQPTAAGMYSLELIARSAS